MTNINEFLDYAKLDDIVAELEECLKNAEGGDERPRLIDHGQGNYIILGYLSDDTCSRFVGKILATLTSNAEKQVMFLNVPEISFDNEESCDMYALSHIVGGYDLSKVARDVVEKYALK